MTPRARLRALPTFADHAKAFGSVDAMLLRLSAGWIHEQQGDPVFRNPSDGLWYDIPEALGGWIALWERLSAHYDLALDFAPLLTLNARLRYGTPITPDLVADCCAIVRACKRAYRRMNVYEIGSIVKTQQIYNLVEAQGLTETAK